MLKSKHMLPLTQVLCLLSFLFGLLVILGWQTNNTQLMHTSFLFMCAGISLVIIDNSYHISLQQQLEKQLLAEHALIKISTRFVGATANDIDEKIEQSLEEALHYTQSDGVHLFILNENQRRLNMTHMARNKNLNIDKDWIDNLPMDPYWMGKLKEQEVLLWSPRQEVDKLSEAFQRLILASNIDLVLDISLQQEGQIVAIISFFNIQKKEERRREINFLKLILPIFLNALKQKNAEIQIQNMNEELIVKIENRAQKLKLANQDLQSIVHVISHDLRTPLVNITGYSGELALANQTLEKIIQESSLPLEVKKELDNLLHEDIKDSLYYIDTGIRKMDKILTGMLQLSKLDQSPLIKQDIHMEELLKSILDSFHFQIKNIDAIVDLSNIINIYGDQLLINQAFSNIIENSLKYRSESRPLHIKISSKIQESNVIYCVQDNGIGISTKNQEKIFELFFREDHSKEIGDGLGLNIVKRILNYHDAEIWAKSELNSGSSFFLEFPVFSRPFNDLEN